MKDFFVGRAVVFAIVLVIALVAFLGKTYLWPTIMPVTPALKDEEQSAVRESSRFTWRFSESDSLNPDGNPATDVFLAVTFSDGSIEETRIDTTHGSCNELPDVMDGQAANTVVAQCYGAGLGYRFRVVATESSYLIQRKEFEEASPDHEPPVHTYETLASFPHISN